MVLGEPCPARVSDEFAQQVKDLAALQELTTRDRVCYFGPSPWDDVRGFWGDETLLAHADAVWRYGFPVRRGCGPVTPTPQTPQAAVLALLDACGGRGRLLECDIPDWDAEQVPAAAI